MKQILLGIPGLRAKMGLTEMAKAVNFGAAPGEIQPPQGPHDPDIEGKGLRESIGEKQDAVGNFHSHSRQSQQGFPCRRQRPAREP